MDTGTLTGVGALIVSGFVAVTGYLTNRSNQRATKTEQALKKQANDATGKQVDLSVLESSIKELRTSLAEVRADLAAAEERAEQAEERARKADRRAAAADKRADQCTRRVGVLETAMERAGLTPPE